MILVDDLFGAFESPDWLTPILFSPEVSRLKEIRLINTSSPIFASLSDTRRFSHTIGVLYLATRLENKISNYWTKDVAKEFLVSSILHDIGTPPFGHLFEYLLFSRSGWNHEAMVENILRGNYRPEDRYHQIYYYHQLKLFDELTKLDVDVENVISIILGKHPLSELLTGTIDIDNIDNVFRMASRLNLPFSSKFPLNLVTSISPDSEGFTVTSHGLKYIDQWLKCRKNVYEIINFDETTLSGQAMLTECLIKGLEQGFLSSEDWYFTDEQLLYHLLNREETKKIIMRLAINDVYQSLFIGWYDHSAEEMDLSNLEKRAYMTNIISEKIKVPCSLYITNDRGTFSKKLTIRIKDNDNNQILSKSKTSNSTIVAIFTPTRKRLSRKKKKEIQREIFSILNEHGFQTSKLITIPSKKHIYEIEKQKKLSI